MKKLGIFIALILLVMVVYSSGILSGENVANAVTNAIAWMVKWLEIGTDAFIRWVKSLL